MKLNINFMIKDGKRIISRDTKGYKVTLNRIVKAFAKSKSDVFGGILTVDVIIQTSKKGAKNKRGQNYRVQGTCYCKQKKIVVWANNCSEHKELLSVLAHEFGHMKDYVFDITAFYKMTVLQQERKADSFAKKITGYDKSPSITGKVRSIAAMNRSR